MEIDAKSCCIACLGTDMENMKNLSEPWKSEIRYLDLLKFLLDTDASVEYSNCLCNLCGARLVDAYLFKKKCFESKDILLKQHTVEEVVADDCEVSKNCLGQNSALNPPTSHDCDIGDIKQVDCISENSCCDEELPIDDSSSSVEDGEAIFHPEDINSRKYSCLKCSIKFASYQEYQSHYRGWHRQKHVCPECGKLVARHNLEKHQLCHSQPEHVCELCGKAFTLRENLTKHIRIHERDHRYECEYCGKKFIHWNSKRCHVISQHTKEKKYECSYCNKKFGHSSNMLRHIRYHTGEMIHSCSYCSKVFNTTSELKNHIITHTKEKNEVCEICKKAFGTRKGLRNHLKTHTGERDYVCPVCNKAFTQAHVLRTHLKSHPDYPMPPPGAILSRKRLEREYNIENSET